MGLEGCLRPCMSPMYAAFCPAYSHSTVLSFAFRIRQAHALCNSWRWVVSRVQVAAAVHVATDSSDRSIAIGLRQIEDTPTRGRNPLSLVMTLPGVQTLQSLDYRGWSGGGIPGINGGQTGQIILNTDGVASQDSGNLNPGYISPSVDSIAET